MVGRPWNRSTTNTCWHWWGRALLASSSYFLSAMRTERNSLLFEKERWRAYHILAGRHSPLLTLISFFPLLFFLCWPISLSFYVLPTLLCVLASFISHSLHCDHMSKSTCVPLSPPVKPPGWLCSFCLWWKKEGKHREEWVWRKVSGHGTLKQITMLSNISMGRWDGN